MNENPQIRKKNNFWFSTQFHKFFYWNCGEPCCSERGIVALLCSCCTESLNTMLVILHTVLACMENLQVLFLNIRSSNSWWHSGIFKLIRFFRSWALVDHVHKWYSWYCKKCPICRFHSNRLPIHRTGSLAHSTPILDNSDWQTTCYGRLKDKKAF